MPLGISLLAGIIYLYTAAPSMLWQDALNLADASATLGINAPPAPLYVFIGHFFTLLPFGSVIFRLQFFSALLASVSLFLLYLLTRWIGEQVTTNKIDTHQDKQMTHSNEKANERNIALAGIFSILALGFSYEFWSLAQNTEKYMLESVLELLVLVLITVVLASRKNIYPLFLIVFFILGLSTGTDPVVLSFFPSVLLVLWEKRREFTMQNFLLLGLTGLAGVILVYSYLPIMSSQEPFLNWGRPTTLSAIVNLATGQQQNTSGNGFTGSTEVFFPSMLHFFSMLWVDFTPIILPFILLGGWFLWKKVKNIFWMIFSVIVTNFILSVLYLSGNQDAWYVLPDISCAIFAGIGFFWLTQKLRDKNWAIYLLFIFSLTPLIFWWSGLNRHEWRITDDYIHNLYSPIKTPAILFGGSEAFSNYSYYNHDILKYNPGVIPVLARLFYIYSPYQEDLLKSTSIQIPDPNKYYSATADKLVSADNYSAFVNDFFAMNMAKYRIYIDYPAFNTVYPDLSRSDGTASFHLDANRFKLIPEGLVYEVVPKERNVQFDLQNFNYQFSNNFPQNKPTVVEKKYNEELTSILNQYAMSYLTIGDTVLEEGNTDLALNYYQKAYAMSPHNGAILSKLGIYYVQHNQPAEAVIYFKQGAASYPNDSNWLFMQAVAEGELGNINDAVPLLQQVIKSTQNDPQLNAKATNVLNKLEGATVGN